MTHYIQLLCFQNRLGYFLLGEKKRVTEAKQPKFYSKALTAVLAANVGPAQAPRERESESQARLTGP